MKGNLRCEFDWERTPLSVKNFLAGLSEEERKVLCYFIAFPDFFSVDWFSTCPPSRLMSVILALEKEGWILVKPGEPGCFVWSIDFPRQIITDLMDPDDLSKCYRTRFPS